MNTTIDGTPGTLPEALWAVIRSRRSVRKFKPESVPRGVLMRIIEAGVQAPSACNIQGWRFILVEKPELRRTIQEAGGSVLIPASPSGILMVYDNTTKNTPYRDDVQSAAACIQTMLLVANGLGLGACWICNLPSPSFLRRLLGIPWNYSPVAYLILGYPLEGARKDMPRRHPLEDIVGVDVFPAAGKGSTHSRPMVLFLRVAYWGYRMTPRVLKRLLLNRIVDRKLTKKFDN
jgi:nitroreductase